MSDPQHSPETARALRVGLVLSDADTPSNGERRLISHLSRDPGYELAGLWAPGPAPVEPAPPLAALERRIAPLPPFLEEPAWAAAQPVTPLPPDFASCDVVVDFSPAADTITGPADAAYGIWRLSAFDPGAGQAEALAAAPATATVLTCYLHGHPPRDLARAVFDTKPMAMRNTAYLREKSVQLIVRQLARLHRDRTLPDPGPIAAPGPAPAGGGTLGYGGRVFGTVAKRLRDRAAARLGADPGGFALRVGHGGVEDFDPASGYDMPNPRGHYWADPFLMEYKGAVYCLFEDYDGRTGLGHIGAGVLTETGMDYLGRAHVAPHHLSYPFLFRHGHDIFMMPETHQAGRLEIWRATDFPLHWELHATGFEGMGLADAVLFEDAGDWWLFTGLCQDSFGDFCGELHLFRVSGPDLTWEEPHPLNPVVIGADTARGGGRVLRTGGRLLRFSQDNSGGVYGWGLNVMEITSLSAKAYAEHRVRHVRPDFAPGLTGCHHLDAAGGRWIMDVRRS